MSWRMPLPGGTMGMRMPTSSSLEQPRSVTATWRTEAGSCEVRECARSQPVIVTTTEADSVSVSTVSVMLASVTVLKTTSMVTRSEAADSRLWVRSSRTVSRLAASPRTQAGSASTRTSSSVPLGRSDLDTG